MVTEAEKLIQKNFPKDLAAFRQIQQVVKLLDVSKIDIDENINGNKISSHIIVEAMSMIYGLELEHGYFQNHYKHSWIRTHNSFIIDVRPIGIIDPIMVDNGIFSKYGENYIVDPNLVYRDFSDEDHERVVNLVAAAINSIIEILKDESRD